jgi:hypothetical protein
MYLQTRGGRERERERRRRGGEVRERGGGGGREREREERKRGKRPGENISHDVLGKFLRGKREGRGNARRAVNAPLRSNLVPHCGKHCHGKAGT